MENPAPENPGHAAPTRDAATPTPHARLAVPPLRPLVPVRWPGRSHRIGDSITHTASGEKWRIGRTRQPKPPKGSAGTPKAKSRNKPPPGEAGSGARGGGGGGGGSSGAPSGGGIGNGASAARGGGGVGGCTGASAYAYSTYSWYSYGDGTAKPTAASGASGRVSGACHASLLTTFSVATRTGGGGSGGGGEGGGGAGGGESGGGGGGGGGGRGGSGGGGSGGDARVLHIAVPLAASLAALAPAASFSQRQPQSSQSEP